MMNDELKQLAIPIHVRLTELPYDEDDRRHRVEFGVVGTKTPASVVFRGGLGDQAVIASREGRGQIELPDRLMDLLATACFAVIAGFVCDYDGQCGVWTARDCSRWLKGRFDPADAEQIAQSLSIEVTPALDVQDRVVVGDDDVVLAEDYNKPAGAGWGQR